MRAQLIKAAKDALSQLEPDELANVMQWAKVVKGAAAIDGAPVASSHKVDLELEYMVLDCIVEVMRAKGADFSTANALKKAPQFKSFKIKMIDDGVVEYLRVATKKNRVALRGIVYLSVELLFKNLVDMKLAISSRTMMAHAHRIPAVLNASFPGYAHSGNLHLIIRREGE